MAKLLDNAVDISEFHNVKISRCKIRDIKLSDEQRVKLNAAMEESGVQTQRIVDVLKTWGYPVSYSAVMRHRKKDCLCG